jgi:hypothetical protein
VFKNTASQKLTVFAFADSGHATLDAGEPVLTDSANISLKIEQDDDGTQTTSNDAAPTEVEDGQYRFDLTQAETNGDKLTFYPQSSTAGVQVVALPSSVIYTRPPNFSAMGIETDGHVHGDIKQVAGQTASASATVVFDDLATIEAVTTAIGATGTGLSAIPWAAAWDAEVQSEVADALTAFAWSGITISAVSGAVGSVTGTVGGIAGTITTLDALDTAQDSQHSTTQSAISGLNDIAATDIVSAGAITTLSGAVVNVDTVDTVTTNSDMRGTDGANTTAPDNSSITAIKTKTDQLVFTVANQVDSNALSGGGSGLDAAGVRTAIGLTSANLDTQLADLPTVAEFEARTIEAANYFDPAVDAVANVTLVGTTTTNSDMVSVASLATSSALATAQADLDLITGTDGVTLATAQANYAPAKSSDVTTALNTYDAPTRAEATADKDAILTILGTPADTDIATDIAGISGGGGGGGGGGSGLTAEETRAALGMASANLDTQLSNIDTVVDSTLGLFSGITSVAQWLGLLAGKQTGDSTARTEIRATGAGSGTFDETTDSLEANQAAIAGISAGSDPLENAVPGAYASGTAGYLIGTNLDAKVSNIAANPVGSTSFEFTVKDVSDQLVPECDVTITGDNSGMHLNKVWSGRSNVNGVITPELDDGNYWFWFQKSGTNFANPYPVVITSGAVVPSGAFE